MIAESPAVADTFLQRRKVEEQDAILKRRRVAEQNERERAAAKAIADRNAAAADLKKTRSSLHEVESKRACQRAVSTFTLDALGQGSSNAGGVKARTKRFEVLDRLARNKAGLSPGQKNDWPWLKEAWDAAMVEEHGERWAELFSTWMQSLLDDGRGVAAFQRSTFESGIAVGWQRPRAATPLQRKGRRVFLGAGRASRFIAERAPAAPAGHSRRPWSAKRSMNGCLPSATRSIGKN